MIRTLQLLFSCWCLVYTTTNLTNLDTPEFVNGPVLCIIIGETRALKTARSHCGGTRKATSRCEHTRPGWVPCTFQNICLFLRSLPTEPRASLRIYIYYACMQARQGCSTYVNWRIRICMHAAIASDISVNILGIKARGARRLNLWTRPYPWMKLQELTYSSS